MRPLASACFPYEPLISSSLKMRSRARSFGFDPSHALNDRARIIFMTRSVPTADVPHDGEREVSRHWATD